MSWLLVFHFVIAGTNSVIIERFESQNTCVKAAHEIIEVLPEGEGAASYNWRCKNIHRVE